jgi:transposase-like protein
MIDFLFRAKREKAAARRFFDKAIAKNGVPETVTIDKSGSNLAALQRIHVSRLERETQGKPDVVLWGELEHNGEHRCSPQP